MSLAMLSAIKLAECMAFGKADFTPRDVCLSNSAGRVSMRSCARRRKRRRGASYTLDNLDNGHLVQLLELYILQQCRVER